MCGDCYDYTAAVLFNAWAGTPRIVRRGPSGIKGAPFGRAAEAMGASAHP